MAGEEVVAADVIRFQFQAQPLHRFHRQRIEVSRIYHWHKATGEFSPRRPRPNTSEVEANLDRTAFSLNLRRAVIDALTRFRRQAPDDTPYALAIITGQCGSYLGYAAATEEGLRRVANEYAAAGYRYRGLEGEESDNLDRLAEWLRWANPDDGWTYGDFAEDFGIAVGLADLVRIGEFGEGAEGLEEFCTEVLAVLRSEPDWLVVETGVQVIVGVTPGEDPRDFLRTATRANDYQAVLKLWAEFGRGEERSVRIESPRSRPPGPLLRNV